MDVYLHKFVTLAHGIDPMSESAVQLCVFACEELIEITGRVFPGCSSCFGFLQACKHLTKHGKRAISPLQDALAVQSNPGATLILPVKDSSAAISKNWESQLSQVYGESLTKKQQS